MTKVTEKTICYLCGQLKETTLDHLPPKFLSPNSPDTEFAMVPACKECNNGYSWAESKFRDFVAAAATGSGNKSADDAHDAALRNYQRSPIARLFVGPSKDLIRVFQAMKKVDIFSKSGKIYLGKGVRLSVPNDPDYEKVLIKIAKGLHFLKTGSIIPTNYRVLAGFLEKIPAQDQEMINAMNPPQRAGDFFHFRGGSAKEDINACVYYMVFYKKVISRVWFMPPEPVKSGPIKTQGVQL